jgi:hypothetical protein
VDFLRRHLTYANVAATLALFLALGGAAYAATQLPKNSVGTKQLRNGAVTTAKIAKKTRRQLQGQHGPAGPQGKTGKQGPKGATGSKGAQGVAGKNGEPGERPAFESVSKPATPTPLTSATQIVAVTLGQGNYSTSAVVVAKSMNGTTITCVLTGGGEASATIPTGGVETLSLAANRGLGGAGSAAVTCNTDGEPAEVTFASVDAIQVSSQTRVQS